MTECGNRVTILLVVIPIAKPENLSLTGSPYTRLPYISLAYR
ncbi:hypothetical protein [Moorena bouillonii]|nr:hypothetical protein [Moorena bouillonii]